MAFTLRSWFEIVGAYGDLVGAIQFRPGGPIGGGDTADGQDEATALQRNCHYLHGQLQRNYQCNCSPYGDASPQGKLRTTTSTSYEEVIRLPVETSDTTRIAMTLELDWGVTGGNTLTAQIRLYDSSATLLETKTANTSSTQEQTEVAITGDATAAWLKIEIKVTAGTGTLYGAVLSVDATTL